ncbi:MAG: dihydroorotase [Candidatus Ranarchaeia archaeon]
MTAQKPTPNIVDLVIKNAKLVSPRGIFEGGLAVENGKIVMIAKDHVLPSADRIVNAQGHYVLPGGVDSHTHTRIPVWLEDDFTTGTRAAAYGGITTIIEMPGLQTDDPEKNYLTTNVKNFKERVQDAEANALVDCALHSGEIQSMDDTKEIAQLVQAGTSGFKITMGGDTAYDTEGTFYHALHEIGKTGSVAMVHAETNGLLDYFFEEAKKRVAQGEKITYSDSRPEVCAVDATSHAITLARYAGTRLHIAHMSTKPEVELVRNARRNLLQPVTSEATVHHLLFTIDDYNRYGHYFITNPPPRTKADKAALWQGLRTGDVDCVCTDHCAFKKKEKDKGLTDILSTPAGIPSLEVSYVMIANFGIHKNQLSIEQLVSVMAEKPARLFGIFPRKGILAVGSDADIVIMDLKQTQTITTDTLQCIADFTPFDGWKIQAKILETWVRGETVAKDGQVTGKPGHGHFIPATPNPSYR